MERNEPIKIKVCCKCKMEKSITEYYKDSRSKDGFQRRCKECSKLYYSRPKEYIIVEKKKCSRCGIEKDASEFFFSSKNKTHLSFWCKECERKKAAKRYSEDPQRQRDYDKKYEIENKEKIKTRKQNYYERNIEVKKDKSQVYYLKNREKILERTHNYYINNHFKAILKGTVRRAKNNGLPYDNVKDLYNKLINIYELKKCECCNKDLVQANGCTSNDSATVDRIIPNKGYTIDNVAILCGECNRLKNNMTVEKMKQILEWTESKIIEQNNQTKAG